MIAANRLQSLDLALESLKFLKSYLLLLTHSKAPSVESEVLKLTQSVKAALIKLLDLKEAFKRKKLKRCVQDLTENIFKEIVSSFELTCHWKADDIDGEKMLKELLLEDSFIKVESIESTAVSHF